ncbi:MAG TPA: hypothetical protein VGJ48_01070, partial [Pyrinomonadaceae bacterium]
HVTDRYFGYCTGEVLFHGDSLLATDCIANFVRFSTTAGRDPSVGSDTDRRTLGISGAHEPPPATSLA